MRTQACGRLSRCALIVTSMQGAEMNKTIATGVCLAFPLLTLSGIGVANAQLTGILDSLKNKATQQVEQKIEQKMQLGTAQASQHGAQRPMLQVNGSFDFTPAPITLYRDDFAATPIGAMPRGWKTNGSGEVVSVQGFPGKWLSLQGDSTFKLSRTHRLPDRFTIDFDLLPVAETPSDIGQPLFGFAGDDRATTYLADGDNDGALNAVDLLFVNSGADVSTYSGATGFNSDPNFSLQEYTNRILHVSIAVDGNRERVYLDHTKILDSRTFQNNPSRYFFISGAMNYDHGAQLLFGNFRIGGYTQP